MTLIQKLKKPDMRQQLEFPLIRKRKDCIWFHSLSKDRRESVNCLNSHVIYHPFLTFTQNLHDFSPDSFHLLDIWHVCCLLFLFVPSDSWPSTEHFDSLSFIDSRFIERSLSCKNIIGITSNGRTFCFLNKVYCLFFFVASKEILLSKNQHQLLLHKQTLESQDTQRDCWSREMKTSRDSQTLLQGNSFDRNAKPGGE